MIKIEDKKSIDFNICNEFYNIIQNKSFCIFDIETTGFNSKLNKVILIGVLYFHNDKMIINQFFSKSPEEEIDILTEAVTLIDKFDTFITYNGDTFDIPFINRRLIHHKSNLKLDKIKSLDLIKTVRKNKNILKLEDCKLKSVEKSLGIYRDDKISGKESIQLYKKYVKTYDKNILDIILKHNYDDIYYLPQLLNIYSIIYNNKYFNYTVHLDNYNINISINLDDVNISKNNMSIMCQTDSIELPKQIYYSDVFDFDWDIRKGILKLNMMLANSKLSNNNKCFYINKDAFDFETNINDNSPYNFPENILLIKEKNTLYYENIKQLLNLILTNIFKPSAKLNKSFI